MNPQLSFPAYAGTDVIIGWVAPVGTNLDHLVEHLDAFLKQRSYTTDTVKVVNFTRETSYVTAAQPNFFDSPSYYERTRFRQEAGNKLREQSGCAVLAAYAVREISQFRQRNKNERRAVHVRSLKHPEEALLLRRTYGSAFFLVGVHGQYETRFHFLKNQCESADLARDLMRHDEYEENPFGQRTREVFELCDGYIEFGRNATIELDRLFNIYFGALDEAPRIEEYGMAMAFQASFASRDLARQVGAAIVNESGDLLATGRNDVPRSGGGLYSKTDGIDVSDYALDFDMGEKYRESLMLEIADQIEKGAFESYGLMELAEHRRRIEQRGKTLDQTKAHKLYERLRKIRRQRIKRLLRQTSMREIVEFGRSVHAEMDALLTCLRNGKSVTTATIFTTTFPCHNCARHIVASGLKRCVYVEPYPKSKALELHSDSISCPAMERIVMFNSEGEVVNTCQESEKVSFHPLVGVAPRRFWEFFALRTPEGAKVERKKRGKAVHQSEFSDGHIGPRSRLVVQGIIEREAEAMNLLS